MRQVHLSRVCVAWLQLIHCRSYIHSFARRAAKLLQRVGVHALDFEPIDFGSQRAVHGIDAERRVVSAYALARAAVHRCVAPAPRSERAEQPESSDSDRKIQRLRSASFCRPARALHANDLEACVEQRGVDPICGGFIDGLRPAAQCRRALHRYLFVWCACCKKRGPKSSPCARNAVRIGSASPGRAGPRPSIAAIDSPAGAPRLAARAASTLIVQCPVGVTTLSHALDSKVSASFPQGLDDRLHDPGPVFVEHHRFAKHHLFDSARPGSEERVRRGARDFEACRARKNHGPRDDMIANEGRIVRRKARLELRLREWRAQAPPQQRMVRASIGAPADFGARARAEPESFPLKRIAGEVDDLACMSVAASNSAPFTLRALRGTASPSPSTASVPSPASSFAATGPAPARSRPVPHWPE